MCRLDERERRARGEGCGGGGGCGARRRRDGGGEIKSRDGVMACVAVDRGDGRHDGVVVCEDVRFR